MVVTDTVWIAFITGVVAIITGMVTGVFGPWIMARQINRTRSAEKQEDWSRQDEVAKRAESTARKMLERQDAATEALEASTRSSMIARQQTHSQLVAIHGLVNSNLTAALQADLDSTHRELAALMEIVEMRHSAGQSASAETTAAVTRAKTRARELEKIMNERREQDQVAKAQIDKGDAYALASDAAVRAAPMAAGIAARKAAPPVVTEVVPPVVKEAVKEALEEHDSRTKND